MSFSFALFSVQFVKMWHSYLIAVIVIELYENNQYKFVCLFLRFFPKSSSQL